MAESVTPIDIQSKKQEMLQFLNADGQFVREDIPEISDEDLLELFRQIVRIRVLEDRMVKLQRQGRIGFYIGTNGEEVTHVCAAYALRDTDLIFPAYREVGPALYRGFPLQTFVDQLFGNAEDNTKGRQMPNHHSGREFNLMSISSPVGTQIPQCAGAAWAAKLRGLDQVSLCFFGDGTSSEGDFHVGLNFAAVYKAPAIFVLRNNGWAISEPTTVQTATPTFHVKAKAYGMPGIRVDGNDVYAMTQAVREAADRARRGEGPTLIEAVTYRLGPHSTSDDPSKYRPEGEYDQHTHLEPLIRLRKLLLAKGLITEDTEQQISEKISAEIIDAVNKAENKPQPSIDSMFEDVFEEVPPFLKKQQAYARRFDD